MQNESGGEAQAKPGQVKRGFLASMFVRDGREKNFQRRILLAIIITVCLCVVAWIIFSCFHSMERSNAVAQQQHESLIECVTTRGHAGYADCLNITQSTRNEESYEYYDLKAQQDMSKWTFLMLVVTSVGVFFVAVTLAQAGEATEAARNATDVTREIGEKQVRAYLSIQNVKVEVERDGHDQGPFGLLITFTVKNLGQSYAKDIRAKVDWNRKKSGKAHVADISANDSEPCRIRVQGSPAEFAVSADKGAKAVVMAEIILKYRTVFLDPGAQLEDIYKFCSFEVELVDGFEAEPVVFVHESQRVPAFGVIDAEGIGVDPFGKIVSVRMKGDDDEN